MSDRTPLGVVRVGTVYIFLAVLVVIARPTVPLVAAGFVFVAAGEAWRLWAAGHLLKSKELAVSGPYRYTQNPLYFGRFLILTGFCIMAWLPVPQGWPGAGLPLNLLVLLVGYAIFFLYYIPRKIRVEGSRLLELHGAAWEAYYRSVPILFPRLSPHGTNTLAWDVERARRNREHWMVGLVVILTALFLVKALVRS